MQIPTNRGETSHSQTSRRPSEQTVRKRLTVLHQELDGCRACSEMIGPVVHGPPVASSVLLIGQAPGPREGSFGRPFAWTAGRTLFRWFEGALGIDEETFRKRVYIAAVARCFPGKAPGGGDRRPNRAEMDSCRKFLHAEADILQPNLIIPVGTLAIEQTIGPSRKLADLIGTIERITFAGREVDAIALPHPSGASPWHKMEPGKTLLQRALERLAAHPEMKRIVSG